MLTRKMLSAMGIEQDKIEQIIEGNAESVGGLQEKIDKLTKDLADAQAKAEKLAGVQKELDELKETVETNTKERGDADAKYEKLKKEFDDYKAEQDRLAVRAKKEEAYKEILKDAGIAEKHYAKILKYSDVDGVELDEKGKIVGAKDILKTIKEEWSDHIQTTRAKGTEVEKPLSNGNGTTMTLEEIDKIEDTVERQKAMLANKELFGL